MDQPETKSKEEGVKPIPAIAESIHDSLRDSIDIADQRRTYRIVVTGGPCAGKTSCMAMIKDHFLGLGWEVYVVREAATLMVSAGVSWSDLNPTQWFHFQKNVMKVMMAMEDTYMQLAGQSDSTTNALVLCDRGLLDPAAYVTPEMYKRLLTALEIGSIEDIREKRYDMVVHLVTAAEGAPHAYTLSNNAARTEDLQAAIDIDKKLQKAWLGHPRLQVIDNSTKFQEKIMRTLQIICKRCRVTKVDDSMVKRRFVVLDASNFMKHCTLHYSVSETPDNTDSLPILPTVKSKCVYTLLVDGNNLKQRVRKRKINGKSFYTHYSRSKEKATGKYEKYSEKRRDITKREYRIMLKMPLPGHSMIELEKFTFLFENHYFHFVQWTKPKKHLFLEIYADRKTALHLPTEYFQMGKEVTEIRSYSPFELSKTT